MTLFIFDMLFVAWIFIITGGVGIIVCLSLLATGAYYPLSDDEIINSHKEMLKGENKPINPKKKNDEEI